MIREATPGGSGGGARDTDHGSGRTPPAAACRPLAALGLTPPWSSTPCLALIELAKAGIGPVLLPASLLAPEVGEQGKECPSLPGAGPPAPPGLSTEQPQSAIPHCPPGAGPASPFPAPEFPGLKTGGPDPGIGPSPSFARISPARQEFGVLAPHQQRTSQRGDGHQQRLDGFTLL